MGLYLTARAGRAYFRRGRWGSTGTGQTASPIRTYLTDVAVRSFQNPSNRRAESSVYLTVLVMLE
jgi:hypothetical protein